MRWMEIAWSQVGVSETPGPRATSEIVGFFRDAGHPEVVSDETAWCAAFACACLERDGIASPRSLMARSFLTFGTGIDTPRIGAIAVFKRGSDPTAGHVGFVAGWTADSILVLGGNQHDQVNTTHFPRADLLALRWPGKEVTPAQVIADGSRIATGADAQQKDARNAAGALGLGEAATQWATDSVAALQRLADQVTGFKGTIEMVEQFLVFAMGKGRTIGLVLGVYFLVRIGYRAGWIKLWRAEDASTGKTGP